MVHPDLLLVTHLAGGISDLFEKHTDIPFEMLRRDMSENAPSVSQNKQTNPVSKDNDPTRVVEFRDNTSKRDELTVQIHNIILIIVKLLDIRRADIAFQFSQRSQLFLGLTLISM